MDERKARLQAVCQLLKSSGYSPEEQIAGYILTGDPAYISSKGNARTVISRIGREEVLRDMLSEYLQDS